jgi:hypothetical protein
VKNDVLQYCQSMLKLVMSGLLPPPQQQQQEQQQQQQQLEYRAKDRLILLKSYLVQSQHPTIYIMQIWDAIRREPLPCCYSDAVFCFLCSRKNSIVLRTQLSVRVHTIIGEYVLKIDWVSCWCHFDVKPNGAVLPEEGRSAKLIIVSSVRQLTELVTFIQGSHILSVWYHVYTVLFCSVLPCRRVRFLIPYCHAISLAHRSLPWSWLKISISRNDVMYQSSSKLYHTYKFISTSHRTKSVSITKSS